MSDRVKRGAVLAGLVLSLAATVLIGGNALDWSRFGAPHLLLIAAAVIGLCAIAISTNASWRTHARLERLRGHIALAATDTPLPPIQTETPDSIDRLYLAVADLIGRRRIAQGEFDSRLEQILGALPDPVIAVTPEGLISLVNAAGRALLDGRASIVGTSIYDWLIPGGFAAAMTESRGRRVPVDCDLETVFGERLKASVSAFADAGGAVIRFAAGQGVPGQVEHDLALHDRPPAIAVTADTLLADLPAIVLDTETTGLNPERDRLISLAGIRLVGSRLYRSQTLDLLVNPGRPIPAVATAVHGISDLMVRPAPGYRAVAPRVHNAIRGIAVIGHHTLFDLTVLRRAAEGTGVEWREPPWLDTALLYSALHPQARRFDLDAVAEALDVVIHGRHTALGDALATAEIYLRMLPVLETRGIRTLGQAMAFQMSGRKSAGQAHAVLAPATTAPRIETASTP